MPDEWKEGMLEIAYNFAKEGQERIDFANRLRVAVEETDRRTCLALLAAFLERFLERGTGDA